MSAPARPKVIAFDVIETLFDLAPLAPRLASAGLHPDVLDTWFSRVLRDAFALDASGVFKPFQEVVAGALTELMTEHGTEPHSSRIDEVLAGFTELVAHPDVVPAMELARARGVRVITLTNGSAKNTNALLERHGMTELVERTVAIEEVKHWKPRAEVYLHAAKTCDARPGEMALVAAHGWDVQGASRAGLMTGYVARKRRQISPAMATPDAAGASLTEVVAALLRGG